MNNSYLDSDHQKIIATIPCFNTEATIKDVILATKKYVDEVMIIDDGSDDNTAITAKNLGAFVLKHNENKGYGKAIKSCFSAALANNADIIITIDGDGQHDPDDIPRLLDPILRREADVIIGSRFLGSNDVPSYRKFGISIINNLWNVGADMKLSDSQSGFRVYRKDIVENLNLLENGMAISIEILEQIRNKGVAIGEIPIKCYYKSSSMNLRSVFHGLGVAASTIKIRLNERLE